MWPTIPEETCERGRPWAVVTRGYCPTLLTGGVLSECPGPAPGAVSMETQSALSDPAETTNAVLQGSKAGAAVTDRIITHVTKHAI